MIDNTTQISNVTRQVETREINGKDAKALMLSQTFDTDERNLWKAITSHNRIPMWFAPVGGDLELNGRFQVEHNAGGTITACDLLRSFDATWEFGESISWIEVRCEVISEDQTELTLAHIAHPDEHWTTYGPGAGGVGWDLSFLGLATHLSSGGNIHEIEPKWAESAEAIDFVTKSGEAWIAADMAGGEEEPTANERGRNTIAFYSGADE